MKKKILMQISLAVLTVSLVSCKGKVESFGQPISDQTITSIKSVAMTPADFNDKIITVEGKIILECPVGGWFNLQQDNAILFVDLHPSGFAIPQKTGSIVTVQGTLKIRDNTPTLIGTGVEIQ